MSINPFGQKKEEPSAVDILKGSFSMGYCDYDFGNSVWDANRTAKDGSPAPGWVKVLRVKSVPVISFTVNGGRGTGSQSIPASEFADYVRSLEEIVESGYETAPGEDRSQYIPTYEYVRKSFNMVQPKSGELQADGSTKKVVDRDADFDVVSVRCDGGKGVKPMLVHRDEFPEVVHLLRSVADNLDKHLAEIESRRSRATAAAPNSDD